ncbi:MAG: alpha/beta hydrolase [Bryobacteraceae bacterium]|nr:alpha/beta hydrolase [Bryobacteraceae bacterium]MDW8378330.1 alpha/beta hydrolase [Bryobacterales bacterium]
MWILLGFLLAQGLLAQTRSSNSYPPVLEGAQEEVYKQLGDVPLKLWVFSPPRREPAKPAAAIVFFFGGGWSGGSPAQFQHHARLLAREGMVAVTADYRVASRHQAKVIDCLRDAKSAIRYLRLHASRLGIDPNRIAAGGGSAGGHLAAAAAIVEGFEEPGEDLRVSSKPNALVLFNPALMLGGTGQTEPDPATASRWITRVGAPPQEVSPFHQMKSPPPPTIIFHGKADATVPYSTVEAFAARCKALGGSCELVGYEGQTHGFFNYGRGKGEYFEKTTQRMKEFLRSIGYLGS